MTAVTDQTKRGDAAFAPEDPLLELPTDVTVIVNSLPAGWNVENFIGWCSPSANTIVLTSHLTAGGVHPIQRLHNVLQHRLLTAAREAGANAVIGFHVDVQTLPVQVTVEGEVCDAVQLVGTMTSQLVTICPDTPPERPARRGLFGR